MNKIEELFVTPELSSLLAELGFDEPCLKVYDELGFFQEEAVLNTCEKDWNVTINRIKAPLYQQVFDWFRTKYYLDSYIKPNDDYYCIYIEEDGFVTMNPTNFYEYKTARQYLIYDLIKKVKDRDKCETIKELNKASEILADLQLNLPYLDDLEEVEKDHIRDSIEELREYLINCKIMENE